MERVIVLMSTYNGEKYVIEQIESILNQEKVDVKLFVRDDNSNDRSGVILDELSASNDKVVVEHGRNLGAAQSFLQLINTVPLTSQFYALADQDDIWEPKKLFAAINKLDNYPKALLYASNQKIVDADNHFMGVRFSDNPPTDLLNIIDKNYLSGCTMVLRKELLCRLRECYPSESLIKSRMHDTWIAAVAACFGEIIYDRNAYIHYRQHTNNVVGVRKRSFFEKTINKIRGKNPYHVQFANELLKHYKDEISEDTDAILKYYQRCDTMQGKQNLLRSNYFRNVYYRNKLLFAFKLIIFE